MANLQVGVAGNGTVTVGAGASVHSPTNNALTLGTNNSERLRITSAGKVGIGTDMGGAPASSYPFGVYTTGTGYLYTETGGSSNSAGLRAKAGTADYTIYTTQGTGQLAVYDNTNTIERLRLDSSGRLIVGNTITAGDASYYDDITINNSGGSGASGGTGITLISSSNSWGSILFGDSSDNDIGAVKYDHNTNSLRFVVNTVDPALKINSSGNVEIGGAAVSQTNRTLAVASNAEANLAIETHNTSASETANIRFYRSRGTGASPSTLVDGDVLAQLIFYPHDGTDYANTGAVIKVECDSTIASNSTPCAMGFYTNPSSTSATERLRITSNGSIQHGAGSTWAAATTNGDFAITVSNLTDNGGNNWRKCGVYVQYSGINADATSSKSAVGYYGIGSVTTWNWFATGEDDVFTADALAATLDNATATSFRLNFNVADNNTGSVTVFVNAYSTKPIVSIAG